jgi:hypothetical protein
MAPLRRPVITMTKQGLTGGSISPKRSKKGSKVVWFNVTQARALNLGKNITLRAMCALQCSDGYANSFSTLGANKKTDAGEKSDLNVAT